MSGGRLRLAGRDRVPVWIGLCALALAAATAWAQSSTPPKTPPSSTKPGGSTTRTAAPPTAKPGTTAKPTTTTRSPAAAGKSTRPAARPLRPVIDLAREAREMEDAGAYERAVEVQRALRRRVRLDGDLELALALNEARSGAVDSALARLSGPTLSAAALDSLPLQRRREYPYGREVTWGNGRFDGWHWYVWRARAELFALRRRWSDAADAARMSVEARGLSGKDWLILAVCAGRAGREEESRLAAEQALDLDPMLPEAFYLAGLWDWKQGRRAAATARFRQAVALDSAYSPAGLALIRSRFPGATPDSLPIGLLTGMRRIALLTSPLGPKPEEFHQMDVSAILLTSPDSAVVDSLIPGAKPVQLVLSVLVDETGRTVLNEVPWFPASSFDFRKVTRILRSVPGWAFHPAQRLGQPTRVWVSVDFFLNP